MSREGHSLVFSHQINKTTKEPRVKQRSNTLEGQWLRVWQFVNYNSFFANYFGNFINVSSTVGPIIYNDLFPCQNQTFFCSQFIQEQIVVFSNWLITLNYLPYNFSKQVRLWVWFTSSSLLCTTTKAQLWDGTGNSPQEFGFPVWGMKPFSLPNVCG